MRIGASSLLLVAALVLSVAGCATKIAPLVVESAEVVSERWNVVDAVHGSTDSSSFLKLEVSGTQDLGKLDVYLYGYCEVRDFRSGQAFGASVFLPYNDGLKLLGSEDSGDDGRFRYTVYAFADLEAISRKPEDESSYRPKILPLAKLEFETVKCHLAELAKVLPLPREPRFWYVPDEMVRVLEWNVGD